MEDQECFSLSYLFSVLKHNHSFIEELKDENENVYELLIDKLYKNSYLFVEFWIIFDSDINNAANKIPDNLSNYGYRQIVDSIYNLVSCNITIDLLKKMLSKIPTFDGYDTAGRSIDLFIKILSEANPNINQELLEEHFSIMNDNRQIYDTGRNGRNYQIKQIIALGYDLTHYENLVIKEGEENV